VHILLAYIDDDSYRYLPHEWSTNNEYPPRYEFPRAYDYPPGYKYSRIYNRPPSYEYSYIRYPPSVRDNFYSIGDYSSIDEYTKTESLNSKISSSSPIFTSSTDRDPTTLLTPEDVFSYYIPSGLRRTYI
jgi:hypothetical protein